LSKSGGENRHLATLNERKEESSCVEKQSRAKQGRKRRRGKRGIRGNREEGDENREQEIGSIGLQQKGHYMSSKLAIINYKDKAFFSHLFDFLIFV
jgi:hypothetical protein